MALMPSFPLAGYDLVALVAVGTHTSSDSDSDNRDEMSYDENQCFTLRG